MYNIDIIFGKVVILIFDNIENQILFHNHGPYIKSVWIRSIMNKKKCINKVLLVQSTLIRTRIGGYKIFISYFFLYWLSGSNLLSYLNQTEWKPQVPCCSSANRFLVIARPRVPPLYFLFRRKGKIFFTMIKEEISLPEISNKNFPHRGEGWGGPWRNQTGQTGYLSYLSLCFQIYD